MNPLARSAKTTRFAHAAAMGDLNQKATRAGALVRRLIVGHAGTSIRIAPNNKRRFGFMVVLSGFAELNYDLSVGDNAHVTCSRGSVLRQGSALSFSPRGDATLEILHVELDEATLRRHSLTVLADLRSWRDDTAIEADDALLKLAATAVELVRNETSWTGLLAENIALAMASIIATQHPQTRQPATCKLPAWKLARVQTYVDSDVCRRASVGDLARTCGLSESHFNRAFREATGISPAQWVMRRRVDRARQLLAQTHDTVASVAFACGFPSRTYFCRVFGRLEGTSPAAWRRRLKGPLPADASRSAATFAIS